MSTSPRECGSRRCPYCHRVQRDAEGRVERILPAARPLTDNDLRWWLCEAQAALGIRSAFGSAFSYRRDKDADTKEPKLELVFCPVGGGGGNSAERGWESERKRAAAARERCIRRRLELARQDGAPAESLDVLIARYSPPTLAVRAERVTGEREARLALAGLFDDLLALVPFTLTGQAELAPDPVAPGASPESVEEYPAEAGDLRFWVRRTLRGGEEIYDVAETDPGLRLRCIGVSGVVGPALIWRHNRLVPNETPEDDAPAGVLPEEHAHLYLWHLGGPRLDVAAEAMGIERHRYQQRSFASATSQDGALARLARLAIAAERAKKRRAAQQGRKGKGLTKDEATDHRALALVGKMRREAEQLLEDAHAAIGVVIASEDRTPKPRPSRPTAPPRPRVERVQALLPGGA